MAFSGNIVCEMELEGFDIMERVLNPDRFMASLRKNVRLVNQKLALDGQDILRKAIHSAKEWAAPNSPATIVIKGSSKPLTDHGDLWGNAGHSLVGAFQFVVGTNRVDRTGNYNVSWILHQGATVTVTDAMRKFFRYLSAKTNGQVKPLGSQTRTIVIPGRPYMKRAFIDDHSFLRKCAEQWRDAVDRSFRDGGDPKGGGGKGGGGKGKGRPGYKFKAGGAGGGGQWVKVE